MRPILLKGHERSITYLKYNKEGDLLFSTSKHPTFAVWYTTNGERLGTYKGHNGAVWSVDVDRHTKYCVSGSADNSAKLWDVQYGKELYSFIHKAPVRSVNFSLGDQEILTVADQFKENLPSIYVYDLNSSSSKPAIEITGRSGIKIMQAVWGNLNETILSANEDGTIYIYDKRKNGEELKVIKEHSQSVMHLSFSKKGIFFISASKDGTAKLFDSRTFERKKVFTTGRPINSASISPIKPEVILGGGQSAESVITTRVDNVQFRIRFFHLIYEEELGNGLPGHFGPVNILSYSPDGTG